jgi:hypothetical protein
MTQRRHGIIDMLHLDAQRLAALADQPPTPDEASHLSACAACAREVGAHHRVLARAKRGADVPLDAPLNTWDAIAGALRAAGQLRDADNRGALGARVRPWMRVAAAVLIGAGGVALGRVTAPGSNGAGDQTASAAPSGAQLAANRGATTADGKPILTLADALRVMQRAETDYRTAVAFIASHDSTYGRGDVDRYRTRLAALDKLSDAARQAVNASPEDLVLNQYLLSAQSAREATMRQLGNTLPAGARLVSY